MGPLRRDMAEPPTPASLLEAALKGDSQAFAELVRSNQDYVRGFIASRCQWPQDVDDLAQEAFVLAYKKLPELKDSNAFRNWVTGIAHNLVRNHQRKHRHTQTESHDTLVRLIDENIEHTSDEHEYSLTALRACLLKLKHEAQALLRQHYVEEMSVKALAEYHQLKHSTITMRLHRCRKLLGDCIRRQLRRGEV